MRFLARGVVGIALVAAALACGPESPAPAPSSVPFVHTEVDASGALRATVDGGEPQVLLEEGLGYRVVPSPDRRWLAVEARMFSDLQVVRVFQLDDGRFVARAPDPAAAAWARAAKRDGFLLEDVLRPRAAVAGWDGDRTLLLELSGDLPGLDERWSSVERVPLPAI